MANPKFPDVFKCVVREGTSYQFQDNVIRSEFGGPPKSRRRFTTPYETVTFRLVCKTQAEMQILYDFCIYTCQDVLPFDWVEWRDPSRRPATYSFQERPVFTPMTSRGWYADIKLDLRTPFNGQFALSNQSSQWLTENNNDGLTT